MTEDVYKQKHHAAWGAFIATEAGADLLKLIDANHPSRKLPKGTDQLGILTNGAVALLNDIGGYEKLADLIRTLDQPVKKADPEPPDRFVDDEIRTS